MTSKREAVRFGIGENGVRFADADRPLYLVGQADDLARAMPLVFYYCDNRNFYSKLRENFFCRILLCLAAFHNNHLL